MLRLVCLGVKHPSGTYDQIFITVKQLWICWCGELSLTRGRVCRLQLLQVLASAVILGSESRGTGDHILLSQIRDFHFVASYDSQGYGGGIRPSFHTGVPRKVKIRVRVALRLAVYRQSVRLGAEPFETHGQIFSQLITCGHSPYITCSLTRGLACHLQLLLALVSAFVLGAESRGTRDRILLFQIGDFHFCAAEKYLPISFITPTRAVHISFSRLLL
jgi:hypothetical protein